LNLSKMKALPEMGVFFLLQILKIN
jgi:hypothetical protein